MIVPKIITHAAQIITHAAPAVAQNKKDVARVLGKGALSISKRHSLPANLSISSIYVTTTCLERQSRTAQSNCTQGYVVHFRKNHHRPLLGNCSVLTLTVKGLELIEEAKKYHLDIIGISPTKRRVSRIVHLDGGWKLFNSGADPSMSSQVGVGILTSSQLSDC